MNEPPYQWQIELRPDDDEMAGVIEDFTGTRTEAERKAKKLTDRCSFFPRALVFHCCGPALKTEYRLKSSHCDTVGHSKHTWIG